MRTERVDEELLLNYLLGNLSEEEQVQVEDRAFADTSYLRALEAAEADLIDSYVRGELSQADRRKFEGRFLTSPRRRGKVEFARALARVTAESMRSQPPVPERLSALQPLRNLLGGWNPALQFAAGMAVVILVAGASWLMIQNAAMRSRVAASEAQRHDLENRERSVQKQLGEEQARSGSLAAQVVKQLPVERTPAPVVASLVLFPGLTRAQSRVEQLVLNSSTQLARIEIQLEARDEYPRFRAELHTRGGQDVLTMSNLSRHRSAAGFGVAFDVPTTALPAGEYELALKGIGGGQTSDIGFYYFRVQKQ